MQEQILKMQKELDELKRIVYEGKFSNLQVFNTPVQFRGDINMPDKNISTGSTTGTIIGISSDKLSIFGSTPVVKQDHIPDPSGGATVDSQSRGTINAILVALENFGLLKTS